MKILIVGAGAIGSFLGGVLHRAGCDMTFFDLPPVVEHLQKEGIRVEGLGEPIHVRDLKSLASLDACDPFDLAIVAVKSYSTKTVADSLPENIAARILTFQNGIGNEEILAERFGRQRVIAGTITYPVSYPSPAHVKIENPEAGMGIAPLSSGTEINDIVQLFDKAGLNIMTCEDYRSLKWSKLLLNIICNATCAILGMTPAEIFSDRRLVKIEREQVLEVLAVMRKKKITIMNLPGYPVKLLTSVYAFFPPVALKPIMKKRVAKARGDKKPSLLIDLEKGLNITEVGFYNGAVYEHGNNCALSMCYNKIITETLEDIAAEKIPRDTFRGKPEAFIQLFRKCQ